MPPKVVCAPSDHYLGGRDGWEICLSDILDRHANFGSRMPTCAKMHSFQRLKQSLELEWCL